MNDKVIFEDLLTNVKAACDLYMHGTIESSTENVHNTMNNTLFDVLQMQNEIYNQMEARGWYKEESVPSDKINQVQQQFSKQSQ